MNVLTQGIQYDVDNVDRGRLTHWHCSSSPRFLLNALAHDIQSIPRSDRPSIMDADMARYTIGFEVEKTRFRRGARKHYPLFAGFERDSSCGVEAITNVLPLLPRSEWRTKVFSLMYDAEKIIDSKYSPTDYNCGGHTTVGIAGCSGDEIMLRLRPYMGIVYSLWRKRLKNGYCNGNLNLRTREEAQSEHIMGRWGGRYQAILVKNGCVEFRLINKFDSVAQMIRRYELFYTLIRNSNKRGMTLNKMWKLVEPIVRMMYKSDFQGEELDNKIEELKSYADSFQLCINHFHEWAEEDGGTWYVFENDRIPANVREFVKRD